MPAEGSSGADQELDSWTNYVTCRWINNPDLSPKEPRPDSPNLIPDSEPSNSATAPREEASSTEDGLASVPSTVQVGSPRPSDGERNASPARSQGGTWRNSDGNWSLKNFYYDEEEEAPREAPTDYSMPPI